MDLVRTTMLGTLLASGIVMLAVVNTSTNAQSFSWGKCTKTLPVMQNFSFEPFVGTWYEEWRVYHLPEAPFKCVYNQVSREDTNGNYNFTVNGGWIVFGKKIFTQLGGHITPTVEINSKWSIHLASFVPHDPYWILSTDYKTYALTFSCEQIGPLKAETAWILRRDPLTPLDPKLVDDLKNYFTENGVDYSATWRKVKNDDCNYTMSAAHDQLLQ